MELKKFDQPSKAVIEHEGKKFFFVGYLMPDENLIIRVRPVTGWIRENGLISDDGAVYVPRYEDVKKGE